MTHSTALDGFRWTAPVDFRVCMKFTLCGLEGRTSFIFHTSFPKILFVLNISFKDRMIWSVATTLSQFPARTEETFKPQRKTPPGGNLVQGSTGGVIYFVYCHFIPPLRNESYPGIQCSKYTAWIPDIPQPWNSGMTRLRVLLNFKRIKVSVSVVYVYTLCLF